MTKPHYRMMTDGQMLPAIRATDGFRNVVANLGTERDKASGNGYGLSTIDAGQLIAAYRGSSVAKAIVDLPAEDSCREWREWQAEADQITAIEAEEKRLGYQRKVMEARTRARLFGGAAIFIGTGDRNLSTPLNPERIRAGGVQYLTVLGKHEITAGEMQRDPRVPGYGEPTFYQMASQSEETLNIHPSRLVIFKGDEALDNFIGRAWDGWADSVLQSTMEKVMHLDGTLANIASLVFEAKVDVVNVKDFSQNLRDGGQVYERALIERFRLAMTAKGINGTLILDQDENYQQKTATFSQLPDVIDRFMQMVSQAARIPMTRFFGMSPGGLNATGDSDIRTYYDRIKQEQTLDMEPAMSVLDECLIRSALGSRPEEVHFNWRPLWQMSEKERAEIADKLTTSAEKMARIEMPMEVVTNSLANALTEVGAFPGLESEMEDYFASGGEILPAVDPLTGDPAEVSDAAPRTLYVRRDVLNADEIIDWAKSQGFITTLPADDMHVTIAFSRKPVDWMKMGQAFGSEMEVAAGGPRLMEAFGQDGEAKVLAFASSELSWRHHEMREAGASWDHPEYQPHITISYDPSAPEVADIEPYRGRIVLGPEIFEEVKENWMEGVSEK